MFSTEKHHKDTLQQMEHKFFEEKVFTMFFFALLVERKAQLIINLYHLNMQKVSNMKFNVIAVECLKYFNRIDRKNTPRPSSQTYNWILV